LIHHTMVMIVALVGLMLRVLAVFDIDAYGDTSYDGDDSDGAQFG